MTINVLGTEYEIFFKTSEEDKFLMDNAGYIDRSVKKIVIAQKDSDCELEDFEAYKKTVMRHEITHAFMEESGLSVNFEHKTIGIDETMVDWIAIQFPKLKKTFEEAGCL
ncbi:hypothetical protein [Novisyntrophococcus fermenticellae]|uniref:hypothetical protein n=1 Tax=Novisyntrophococcus fermenticellae TaxID=2068655 RepID=UPI001E646BE5|nr:hypothetical protein [Novisyntrophococcus fermenticellae]